MKKCFFTTSIIFISAVVFAQDSPASEWVKTNMNIDGHALEWNPPLKHYDNNTNLFFDFKNDSNNLYVCFQSTDEANQFKIMRSGMKIILSSKINGKRKATVNFPLALKTSSKAESSGDGIEGERGFMRQKMQAAFLSADTLMELKGFANKNGMISTNDKSGVQAAINWDKNNTFTYEIAIPLKEMFGNDYDTKDISKDISLDVIINAMSRPKNPENHGEENGYSGRGGEGGGMGGGSYGGGMNRSNRMGGRENSQFQSDRSAMFEKSEMKQKFALATHD